jgi:glucokinase
VAIDTLAVTLAPEAVLIGGGLGGAMAAALARVPKGTGDWFAPRVLPAALGDDAGVIGAAAAALRAHSKRAVLVNGVPASGKSHVAQALAAATGWPVLALDTVKEPFLEALQPVDRAFNRRLGQAAYQAIFGLLADAPPGGTFILDAWFGFQPPEILDQGLARAGVARAVEIWCRAAPEEIGRRYATRAPNRIPGHPGVDYVPELIALARRAAPQGTRPVLEVDTSSAVDGRTLAAWAMAALAGRA